MKVKNLLISILMIGLASYGGLKLYMWQKAKQDIDIVFNGIRYAMSAAFDLRVDAGYKQISTSIFGPVGIRDVYIRIPAIEEEITVAEFKLLERDLDIDLNKGAIPLRVHFFIDDLKISVSLIEKIQTKLLELQTQNNINIEDPNSIISRLGYQDIADRSNDLRALGYDLVDMNFEFDMIIDPVSKEASMFYHQVIKDMGEVRTSIKMADMSNNINSAVLGLRIKEATIKYSDDSYIDRFIKLYAAENKMELEEFRKRLVTNIEQDFTNRKIKLSKDSVANIKRFLKKPDKLVLTVYPYQPVAIESLKHYKPGDVPMLLNLQVHLE